MPLRRRSLFCFCSTCYWDLETLHHLLDAPDVYQGLTNSPSWSKLHTVQWMFSILYSFYLIGFVGAHTLPDVFPSQIGAAGARTKLCASCTRIFQCIFSAFDTVDNATSNISDDLLLRNPAVASLRHSMGDSAAIVTRLIIHRAGTRYWTRRLYRFGLVLLMVLPAFVLRLTTRTDINGTRCCLVSSSIL